MSKNCNSWGLSSHWKCLVRLPKPHETNVKILLSLRNPHDVELIFCRFALAINSWCTGGSRANLKISITWLVPIILQSTYLFDKAKGFPLKSSCSRVIPSASTQESFERSVILLFDKLTILSLFRDRSTVVGRVTKLLLARFNTSRFGRGRRECAESSESPQWFILRTRRWVLKRKWGGWGMRRCWRRSTFEVSCLHWCVKSCRKDEDPLPVDWVPRRMVAERLSWRARKANCMWLNANSDRMCNACTCPPSPCGSWGTGRTVRANWRTPFLLSIHPSRIPIRNAFKGELHEYF